MPHPQLLSSLRAMLFAGAAVLALATAAPTASAVPNQSFAEQPAVAGDDQGEPVIECGTDEVACGEDLCCTSGQECCAPSGSVPYCAASC